MTGRDQIAWASGAHGTAPKRRLLASIHDVSPRFEPEVDELAARLSRRLNGPRFAMLVVPDHWGDSPVASNPRFRGKLRAWSDAGVEMFVHGWSHRDESARRGFRQRHMTAGEGEFAALSAAEACRRMRSARQVVEDAIARPATGFIAPAWLYSAGARAALREEGFPIAEDHLRVWRPSDGRVLARGPVVTWASRSKARTALSLGFARAAAPLFRLMPSLRIAVHPGDTRVPALLDSIDMALVTALRTHLPGRYADLG